jgi:hypothetical protein
MSGHVSTRVQVPLVLGQQINVMENKTLPVIARPVQRLQETNVHEETPIELQPGLRLYQIDRIVELLFIQERMQVPQEQLQVGVAVTIRNDYGYFKVGYAAFGLAEAARVDRKFL